MASPPPSQYTSRHPLQPRKATMSLSEKAQALFDQIAPASTRRAELKRLAKGIKTDHTLALELWSTGNQQCRMLAVLIFDKKQIDQAFIDTLDADLQQLDDTPRVHLMEWLLANQLMKSRPLTRLVESWENSPSSLQRRTFWYLQARQRWTGQKSPPNTEALLDALEARLEDEVPEVQWAMNFTACQIGTFQEEHRARCVALGERVGLYRDEKVPRGCVPSFLPEYIRVQSAKVAKK